MNIDAVNAALENLDKIDALLLRKMELHRELRRALLFIQLCGEDPHKLGKVFTYVEGNVHGTLRYIVSVDGKEYRLFPLQDVPVVLWPQWVIDDLPHNPTNKYRKILKQHRSK